MKRIIVDYEKLTSSILDLLVEKYPDGYGYKDIISFKNAKGKLINTIEVCSDDTIYLVKISNELEQTLDDYIDDETSFLEEVEQGKRIII